MSCTTFRPAGYLQRGDRVVYTDAHGHAFDVTVRFIDNKTGMAIVDGDGSPSFPVNSKNLRRV